MADIDLKTATPDTSLPTTGFLFGADSQASASPSVYSTQTVATTLLGSTSLTGATLTTSQPVLDLAQTWNASGVTFTGLRFNAAGSSDANSAAASLLMDLQVGGTSRFKVQKNGDVTFASTGGTISFSGSAGLDLGTFGLLRVAGVSFGGSNDLILGRRTAANLRLGAADTTGTTAPTAQTLSVQSWTSSTNNNQPGANFTIAGSQGTGTGAGGSIIFQVAPAGAVSNGVQNALATAFQVNGNGGVTGQDGATVNTLALRNGTNAQTFRVYNTTDGTNGDFFKIEWASNSCTISTDKLGAGSNRSLIIRSSGQINLTPDTTLYFGGGSNPQWQVGSNGHLLAYTDNTYDIGATGANRPRSIYAGTSIEVNGYFQASDTGSFFFQNRSVIKSAANGDFTISNRNQTDFGRLNFGGTTSSFPALKRSSTTLQARLADDSAFASVQGKLTTDTAYTAGDPTTTGYLVVYDSAGVAYKIPAVAV